jgi:hypothetical protein
MLDFSVMYGIMWTYDYLTERYCGKAELIGDDGLDESASGSADTPGNTGQGPVSGRQVGISAEDAERGNND